MPEWAHRASSRFASMTCGKDGATHQIWGGWRGAVGTPAHIKKTSTCDMLEAFSGMNRYGLMLEPPMGQC